MYCLRCFEALYFMLMFRNPPGSISGNASWCDAFYNYIIGSGIAWFLLYVQVTLTALYQSTYINYR